MNVRLMVISRWLRLFLLALALLLSSLVAVCLSVVMILWTVSLPLVK